MHLQKHTGVCSGRSALLQQVHPHLPCRVPSLPSRLRPTSTFASTTSTPDGSSDRNPSPSPSTPTPQTSDPTSDLLEPPHQRQGDASPSRPVPAAPAALVGQGYLLTLDIGREKHTWMDPTWAASGRRVEVPVAVRFEAGGGVKVLGIGAFAPLKLTDGQWQQKGSTLSFWLETPGFSRGDVGLPEGRLYVNVPVWGSLLSKDKGTLTIQQRRWVVRLESRLVGRLRARPLVEGEGEGAGGIVELGLGPARTKAGSLDGPLYYSGGGKGGQQ